MTALVLLKICPEAYIFASSLFKRFTKKEQKKQESKSTGAVC